MACAGLVSEPRSALSGAHLAHATPADAAVLNAAPRQLELCFNLLLDYEFHRIELFRIPHGSPVRAVHLASIAPRLDDEDATRLTGSLPPLSPGAYMIRWQVLSRDGSINRGRLRFEVRVSRERTAVDVQ